MSTPPKSKTTASIPPGAVPERSPDTWEVCTGPRMSLALLSGAHRRRRCERVSRLIVKLRGHGLVAKIPRARRYRVIRYGQHVMTAAIALHDNDFPAQFMAAA